MKQHCKKCGAEVEVSDASRRALRRLGLPILCSGCEARQAEAAAMRDVMSSAAEADLHTLAYKYRAVCKEIEKLETEIARLSEATPANTVHACRLALCFLTAGECEPDLWPGLLHDPDAVGRVVQALKEALQ